MSCRQKLFYWSPRLLSIAYIIFLSLFALDVFSEYKGFAVVLPLFMHSVPSLVLAICVFIAWKYDVFGAFIFLGFSIFYIWDIGFSRPLSWYLLMSFPSAVIGVLYFASWMQKRYSIKHCQSKM